MSTSAVLTLDQGTTGSRAIVVARDGRVLGASSSEFTQYFPKPGWVEHDAAEIREVTLRVAREAIAASRDREPVAIEGIGITNQRETLVVWDRETGEPVHRAIVWQDRRTAPLCRRLKEEGREEEIRRRTGLVLDPYFSGTKLTWLLSEVPGLRKRAEAGELACGTIDSWLIYILTAGRTHATDPTNASRTLLYGLESGTWEDGLLEVFGVPRSMLPEVRPSSGYFGNASGEVLGIEPPIAGVAGDQQAALFGQGCWAAGMAKNTYGTGAFFLLNTGDEAVLSRHGLLTTVACGPRGERAFALEGSVFIAGAAIQWLRDGLGLLKSAAESEAMAASLSGNDGVYFVPAFVGLGAPYWDPEARGAILGLTRGTTKAHMVRAALEAMAFSTAEVLHAMEADSGIPITQLRVDGGVSGNDWLMSFQAGILDVSVRRPANVETTAFGAAGLAGLHVGLWKSGEEFLAAQGEARIFSPEMGKKEREALRGDWGRAVRATRNFV